MAYHKTAWPVSCDVMFFCRLHFDHSKFGYSLEHVVWVLIYFVASSQAAGTVKFTSWEEIPEGSGNRYLSGSAAHCITSYPRYFFFHFSPLMCQHTYLTFQPHLFWMGTLIVRFFFYSMMFIHPQAYDCVRWCLVNIFSLSCIKIMF